MINISYNEFLLFMSISDTKNMGIHVTRSVCEMPSHQQGHGVKVTRGQQSCHLKVLDHRKDHFKYEYSIMYRSKVTDKVKVCKQTNRPK